MEARAYEAAARIVVHSSGNRAFLQERKRVGDKIRVIHNWVDLDAVRPGARNNSFRTQFKLGNRFVISYAGVMGYAQDLGPVIQSAAEMSDDDVVFLLVGDGVLRERWMAMAAERHATNVVFLPMQSKETYSELLSASDVCLVPLDATLTTPVVPGKLQAIMAAGRPAVALARPGGDTPKLIDASGAGICLEPSNAAGLTEALRGLRANPQVGHEMGRRGRRFAETHFSLRQAADDYEALFFEVGREPRELRDRS
jgi:glycosyltransferase involved in cell wall biosynthesis